MAAYILSSATVPHFFVSPVLTKDRSYPAVDLTCSLLLIDSGSIFCMGGCLLNAIGILVGYRNAISEQLGAGSMRLCHACRLQCPEFVGDMQNSSWNLRKFIAVTTNSFTIPSFQTDYDNFSQRAKVGLLWSEIILLVIYPFREHGYNYVGR